MSKCPLEDEIRELAEQLAAAPDVVADLAADAATLYRRERMLVLGMAAVDAMVQNGPQVGGFRFLGLRMGLGMPTVYRSRTGLPFPGSSPTMNKMGSRVRTALPSRSAQAARPKLSAKER